MGILPVPGVRALVRPDRRSRARAAARSQAARAHAAVRPPPAPAARPRLRPALDEERLHLQPVALAQLPGRDPLQHAVDAPRLCRAHAVSLRAFTRARAILSSSSRRRVSPRATWLPARVMR